MSNATYFVLALLGGWFGLHKFVQKQTKTGILYLFTFGLFGIGWFVDIIIAASKLKSQSTKAVGLSHHNYTMQINVVGEHYKKNDIASVMSGNRMYNLPDHEFINKIEPRKYIYRFKYRETEAQLILEPNNPYDANAIKVVIDNIHVGYVPASYCVDLKRKLPKIKSVRAKLHGGDYKYHSNNEVFKTESDFSIELDIMM